MVTIGLPCYNAEKTVKLTVNSIINQSFKDWTLIAVDDGSTDSTLSLLKSYKDPRIQVIADGKNCGLAARLNQISSITETSLLFRMDSDDIMFPDRLQKQIDYMQANPDCDLLGSEIIAIDSNNKLRTIRKPRSYKPTVFDIFKGEVIFHPSICGRAEWFKNNPYDESLKVSEDYELWCRCASQLKIHVLNEPLLFYREHGSFAYKKFRDQSLITLKVIKKYGPKIIGKSTGKLLFERRVKGVLGWVMHKLGLWNKVLDSHGEKLCNLSDYEEALDKAID